jgi:eukaryotic-like serine/threonine-protein kinase
MGPGSAVLGQTLGGRFRITGYIGQGAMAAVYRGVEDDPPREVAIKVLHRELADDETVVRRFRREARAAARLRHPNSVQVYAHGVEGRLAFMVMELLPGMDLFELLELEGRLPEARAARIMLQICDALAAAHDLGIVHRDLKPENVMIVYGAGEGDEQIKVCDFGIAKILERPEDMADGASYTGSALTRAGSALGTPTYMSPEQCQGIEIDGRSDVYACGIMLYQLVTGQPPFLGQTDLNVMLQQLRDPPVPPSKRVPGLLLEPIILKALEKDRDKRQQTARDLQAEIAALLPELVGPLADAPTTPLLRRGDIKPAPKPVARAATRAYASTPELALWQPPASERASTRLYGAALPGPPQPSEPPRPAPPRPPPASSPEALSSRMPSIPPPVPVPVRPPPSGPDAERWSQPPERTSVAPPHPPTSAPDAERWSQPPDRTSVMPLVSHARREPFPARPRMAPAASALPIPLWAIFALTFLGVLLMGVMAVILIIGRR